MLHNRLLFIDDERNILRSLERLFSAEDYETVTAQNAEEGLKRLQEHDIDLIICDYQMPGMKGITFLQETMPDYPDIIRILLTGQADLDMALEAINSGCVYKFIVKPWNNDDLLVTVRRALEYKQIRSENRNLTDELRKRDSLLRELEKQHPGITRRPRTGSIRYRNSDRQTKYILL